MEQSLGIQEQRAGVVLGGTPHTLPQHSTVFHLLSWESSIWSLQHLCFSLQSKKRRSLRV